MAKQGNIQNMLYFRARGKTLDRVWYSETHNLFAFRPNVSPFNNIENCISYNHPKCWSVITIWSSTRENLTLLHAHNKWAEQPAQLQSLVSTFVIFAIWKV